MRKLVGLFCFLLVASVISFGQTTEDLIAKADTAQIGKNDFNTAIEIYRKIKPQLNKSDKNYRLVEGKLAAALFNQEIKESKNNNFSKSLDLSKEFIELLNKDSTYFTAKQINSKYWAYKNIIVDYFGLGQRDMAKPYQDKLYQGYKNKELPKGLDTHYCFEKFVYENKNVWGYEWYPQLGDKETEEVFSKHVYYIYSSDDEGNDKEQLYTLHTRKVHKLDPKEPDFVLTLKIFDEQGEEKRSSTFWKYTFSNPVDYVKLHNAIVEILKKGLAASTVDNPY